MKCPWFDVILYVPAGTLTSARSQHICIGAGGRVGRESCSLAVRAHHRYKTDTVIGNVIPKTQCIWRIFNAHEADQQCRVGIISNKGSPRLRHRSLFRSRP